MEPAPADARGRDGADIAAGSLVWAIRDSFRAYIEGLPDAETTLADGAGASPEGFSFRVGAFPGFEGSLRIRAHDGALDITFASPALEAQRDGIVLTADTGAGRLPIARLLDLAALPEAGSAARAADVALTPAGSEWLGGVYAPWTRMAPVLLRRG